MKRQYTAALLAGTGAAIAVSAWLLLHQRGDFPESQTACGNTAPAFWYDPMHATEHFDKPGRSPFMDMQLVPQCKASRAVPSEISDGPGNIEIDSRVVQNLGIRLCVVEQGRFERSVDTVGLVGVDEHRIEAIQVREAGWVEDLRVRAAGDSVQGGQELAGVYSPTLLATQQEFLIARDSNDPHLIEAAHTRLALLGLSTEQIAHIERTGKPERRVTYYAPFDGFVMELGVRQGAAVGPGATLFQLARLDSVWITAEVPETQSAWIKPGDWAEVQIPALPGMHFKGQVDYLYPELTQSTRSLKVRVVVNNPGLKLRPGMFASAHVRGAAVDNVLTVPSEAVIKTGTRSIVVVADDGTHFRPVVVRAGAERGDRTEILDGLTMGQSIVASGQFLIDSEASLRGALESLGATGGTSEVKIKPELMPSPADGKP
jgi:Cu(I)/Ag(I) efflux system membrane fusion protein